MIKCTGPAKAIPLLLATLLATLLCTGQVRAQSAPVTLRFADVPLERVLDAVERQTSYLFVYDRSVDVGARVSIDVVDMPLKNALDALLRTTDIRYAVENTNIVLSHKPAAPERSEAAVVSGEVVDADGVPVVGAAVVVKGTTTGATTGPDGSFTLRVSDPAEAVLTVNYLGYAAVELPVGGRTSLRVELREEAVGVDAVVVTALGIKRSEKALAYNVQQVASEELLTVRDANFVNALNGKVAGVNINASSAGVGGASKVVMRGTKAIDQSSNALYVIDGVPVYTLGGDGDTEFQSRGRSEAIADINPEDIESISVLTGAAAAALYGSHASNGAVVITTKRGLAGQTSVTVSSNTELLAPFVMPRFQNRYGTGDVASDKPEAAMSWGRRLNAANRPGYEPTQDYFRTGIVGTESVSFTTGTERNQTYLSAGAVDARGVVPNNGYDRYNFTFRNTTSFLRDRMKLDVGAGYIRQKDRNMTNQGIYSNPLVSAYLFPRGDDWERVRMFERYDPERKIMTQYWPLMGKGGIEWDNPYWTNYRNLRENDRNRYMIHAGLTYKIFDWMTLSGRLRLDNSENAYTEKFYASTNPTIAEGANGLYGIEHTKEQQFYGDALLDIDRTFGDWSLHVNAGGSFSNIRVDGFSNRGPIRADGLANVFNVFQLDDSQTKRTQSGWREQYQSLFASLEVGWRNACYLTLTGRNDWPSQLAGPNSVVSSFFYPSVGASVVLSELIPNMPENLSYVKVRGSFASVGLPFARFLANPTYEWDPNTKTWETKSHYPLYDLKPERTDSWEVGLTLRFLRHFEFDASYYDTKTFNQTFDPQLSVSSGYKTLYVQTGNVRNRGVELSLGYRNTWRRFSWSSDYTFSANKNTILELLDDYVHPETGALVTMDRLDVGGLQNARFLLKPGGSLGDLYSLVDLRRDADGYVYVGPSGEPVRNSKAGDLFLGSVLPTANMAWRNDFRWGNFRFGFLVSARLGGIVYSATQARLDYFGVSEATAAARDAGGVRVNGIDRIDARKWYATVASENGIPQYYTYDATNVRLQEASIGYTIPRKALGGLCELTVSLVGRNLWMIWCKAPFDPESVATTGNYYQGIDYFMMPSMRSIGCNVRLKF